jgi:hypothetical protein
MSSSSSSADVETFLRKPDDDTTGSYVIEFLNSRFRELEDLEELGSILSGIKKREAELEAKVFEYHFSFMFDVFWSLTFSICTTKITKIARKDTRKNQ